MKLRHVRIENFKGIKHCEFSLLDQDGRPFPRFTLVGDNGSGKTSVLQAVYLVLRWACSGNRPDLMRQGLFFDRISSLGASEIHLDLEFGWSERAAAEVVFPEARAAEGRGPVPVLQEALTVSYSYGDAPKTPDGLAPFQCMGRRRAEVLEERGHVRAGEWKAALGDVFLLEQDRDLGDLNQLRERMVLHWAAHSSGGSDASSELTTRLSENIAKVFGDVHLAGVAPMRPDARAARESFIWLQSDGRRYDIQEASAGERAVWPLLYQFAVEPLGPSIVLIDELELHLHPPAQQALYHYLRKLGPDCQFIITTHSQALVDIIPREEMHRLEGGRPCL